MISWRCVVLLSISSCAAATVDATTAATRADKDALCYVDRYADLHRHFCVADTCDLQRARDHYRDHGAAEGREPNPETCSCYEAYCDKADRPRRRHGAHRHRHARHPG